MAWSTIESKLYLFGGLSPVSACTNPTSRNVLGSDAYFLNDLWSFQPSTSAFFWASSSNPTQGSYRYGTVGAESSTSLPPARHFWNNGMVVDSQGSLWLFGGASSSLNLFLVPADSARHAVQARALEAVAAAQVVRKVTSMTSGDIVPPLRAGLGFAHIERTTTASDFSMMSDGGHVRSEPFQRVLVLAWRARHTVWTTRCRRCHRCFQSHVVSQTNFYCAG